MIHLQLPVLQLLFLCTMCMRLHFLPASVFSLYNNICPIFLQLGKHFQFVVKSLHKDVFFIKRLCEEKTSIQFM